MLIHVEDCLVLWEKKMMDLKKKEKFEEKLQDYNFVFTTIKTNYKIK